jgi:hypothetical protein
MPCASSSFTLASFFTKSQVPNIWLLLLTLSKTGRFGNEKARVKYGDGHSLTGSPGYGKFAVVNSNLYVISAIIVIVNGVSISGSRCRYLFDFFGKLISVAAFGICFRIAIGPEEGPTKGSSGFSKRS